MNYTIYHLHSDYSSGVAGIDSITKYNEYIARAKECGMKALAFSEHGSVFGWKKKKDEIEAAGMKYIHAIEAYLTESTEENKIRDNYHCILIAKNYEGVKELNKLSSNSFNKNDRHFYYRPRITMDELYNTSDNIIVTSSCLGSVLYNGDEKLINRYLEFFLNNKDRCFLEIQHHNDYEQKKYNELLYKLSKKTGLKLIAGTDTHALNKDHFVGREILQRSKLKMKNSENTYEDNFDLTFKSYSELVEAYEIQGVLPKEVYLEAIENTNVLADMVEEFELDYSHKYPHLWGNSEKTFCEKIIDGIKEKGIDKKENSSEYLERIKHELETYKHNDAIDFMLLEEDYKSAMRKKGVVCGYGRGSVSGSLIAYLLGITDIDSVAHKLNFERFMNPERISLADIDSDWYAEDGLKVRKYLFNKEGLYCSEIITFNTLQLKGALRDVARVMDEDLISILKPEEQIDKLAEKERLKKIDYICKTLDTNEEKYRKEHPELFKWADLFIDVIVSVGSHAAGFIVSPYPLDESIGTFYSKESKFPVSQINMKEVDSLNYVKLDILGLDNVGLINKTSELANLPRLTPDNIPANDINVWKSIRDDTTCIFQWEGDYASSYLKRLFSDDTIEKIKSKNPNFSYMDLFSIGTGAIRPAGASYREELAQGIFKDSGNDELNNFLAPTLGFLVFQEQIIEFLHKFCGYTMGEADIVRRHFSKKIGTDKDIPRIKEGFIKTMTKEHNVSKEDAEKLIEDFLVVIEDASDYLFSLNHADAYSWIGYVCGYLRYYYPLEFLTTALNIFENKEEKSIRVIDYANKIGVKIKGIRFRYSLAEYNIDKENNVIYKGISSIKYLNKKIARELYELRDNVYNDFFEVLDDIHKKTSVNSVQLEILIQLNFFIEFGNINQLSAMTTIYNIYSNKIQYKKEGISPEMIEVLKPYVIDEKYILDDKFKIIKVDSSKSIELMRDVANLKNIKNIKTSMRDILDYEVKHLGTINLTIPSLPESYKAIVNIDGKFNNKYVTLYTLKNGEKQTLKVRGTTLENNPIERGNVIKVISVNQEKKWQKNKGEWIQIDEYESILKLYQVLKD